MTRVFVGNVPYEMTRQELTALLAPAGSIMDLHLPADRETGRPRGFAFVAFATEAEAAEAIRRFDQVEVRGRRLALRLAEDRPPGASRPFAASAPPFGAGGFGGPGGRPARRARPKGSRRGLRARKRSL